MQNAGKGKRMFVVERGTTLKLNLKISTQRERDREKTWRWNVRLMREKRERTAEGMRMRVALGGQERKERTGRGGWSLLTRRSF